MRLRCSVSSATVLVSPVSITDWISLLQFIPSIHLVLAAVYLEFISAVTRFTPVVMAVSLAMLRIADRRLIGGFPISFIS